MPSGPISIWAYIIGPISNWKVLAEQDNILGHAGPIATWAIGLNDYCELGIFLLISGIEFPRAYKSNGPIFSPKA